MKKDSYSSFSRLHLYLFLTCFGKAMSPGTDCLLYELGRFIDVLAIFYYPKCFQTKLCLIIYGRPGKHVCKRNFQLNGYISLI